MGRYWFGKVLEWVKEDYDDDDDDYYVGMYKKKKVDVLDDELD